MTRHPCPCCDCDTRDDVPATAGHDGRTAGFLIRVAANLAVELAEARERAAWLEHLYYGEFA
jgi:hypothetical protein